ncbi:cytochrome c [Lentisphaera marina]|uniref:c-type cytochrome n=1 Tax=Lentisphaera marina TaxID=1111041 RepID=UPI002365DD28|nr:cytochrome c [Lentisphaera marina]MDD7983876.1 cytochrome c [Lentisphaera marina]
MKKFLFTFISLGTLCQTLVADSIKRGEEIYKQVCHICHGLDMNGGIGPSLIDDFWKHGDSPHAVLHSISEGIPNTEMAPYKQLFKEDDLKAARDFILSKQKGLRSLALSSYPKAHFKGKKLSLDLLKTVESLEQKSIKENLIYFKNRYDAVAHLKADLYIQEDGVYGLRIRKAGRTAVYINGKEVLFQDENNKSLNKAQDFKLTKGVHKIEILHDEKMQHSLKFHATMTQEGKGHFTLMGKSLEGSEPKMVRAGAEAKVIRKYVHDISPRTLLCLLPNKVLVAYNPYSGKIEKVWKNSFVDQTPSLNARSALPSSIMGQELPSNFHGYNTKHKIKMLSYQSKGGSVLIKTAIGGKEHKVTISPLGATGFSLKGESKEAIPGFELVHEMTGSPKTNSNFKIDFN